jgi:hypothetical protein
VGDHGGPGYLHGLCIWISGYSPKIICLMAAISRNLAPKESAICEQRGEKDFGQPASACPNWPHITSFRDRVTYGGGILVVVEGDAAIPAFLGHNAVYLLAGFLCFCWLKHEEGEVEPITVQKHSREGYNLAALLFFFLFLDNLLRSVEGQGWKGFWPCSGRFEVVVLFGMLSLVTQLVYWSRIVSGLNQERA